MPSKIQDFKIWFRTLDCPCGEKVTLDILGKNFGNHIKDNPSHLKYMAKLWKTKRKLQSGLFRVDDVKS